MHKKLSFHFFFSQQECAERGRAGAAHHGRDVAANDLEGPEVDGSSPEVVADQLRLLPARRDRPHLVSGCLHRRHPGESRLQSFQALRDNQAFIFLTPVISQISWIVEERTTAAMENSGCNTVVERMPAEKNS